MRRDWERQKEKLFEELGRHQASGAVDSSRRKVGGFERNVRCFLASFLFVVVLIIKVREYR